MRGRAGQDGYPTVWGCWGRVTTGGTRPPPSFLEMRKNGGQVSTRWRYRTANCAAPSQGPGAAASGPRRGVGGGEDAPCPGGWLPVPGGGCRCQCLSRPLGPEQGKRGQNETPTSGCAAPPLLRRPPGGRDKGPRSPSAGAVCPQGEPQGAGLGPQEGSGAPDILPSSPLPSGPASPRLPPPCGTRGEVTPGGRHVHRDRSRGRSPNPVRGHSLPQEGAGPGVLPREPPGVRPAWTPLPSLAAA